MNDPGIADKGALNFCSYTFIDIFLFFSMSFDWYILNNNKIYSRLPEG